MLYRSQPLETRVNVFRRDDMVVHRDAERLGDLRDRLRHLDARLGMGSPLG
jgi:hypothetical protein